MNSRDVPDNAGLAGLALSASRPASDEQHLAAVRGAGPPEAWTLPNERVSLGAVGQYKRLRALRVGGGGAGITSVVQTQAVQCRATNLCREATSARAT